MSINQKIVDSRTEYQRHIASVESFIVTAESQSSTKNILLSSITRFVSEIKSSISLNDAEKKDILAKMKTSQPLREVYTELRGEKELLTFDELIPEWKNKDGSEVRITSHTVSFISHVLQISDITLDDIHQSMLSFESRDIEPNEDDVQKLKSDFSSLDVSLQTSPEGNAIEQKIHHFVFIVSLKKKSFAEYIEVIKLLDTTKEIDTLIKVSTRLSQAFSKAIAYYTSQEISKTQDGQPIYKNAAAVDMFQLLQKKLTEVLSETVQKRYTLIQKDIENTELQESITRLEKLSEVLKIHHISGVLV